MEEYKYKTHSGIEISLTMEDMMHISKEYAIRSTQEYLVKNYKLDDETARDMAFEVRRKMDKYGFDEEEAIEEVKDDFITEEKTR